MRSFESVADAQRFMHQVVDVPVPKRQETITGSIRFTASTVELPGHRFTNIYDVQFQAGQAVTGICLPENSTSLYDLAADNRRVKAAVSGGFFFLADCYSMMPRQQALNLAVSRGALHSLPVIDREAIMTDGTSLTAGHVRALGQLSIGGRELSWSGSLTEYETEAKVYGNGNCVIVHQTDETNGSIRVLDEASRFTPPIDRSDMVDIGFTARGDGSYVAQTGSRAGRLDIFSHDIVVRCHERHLGRQSTLQVHSVDFLRLDSRLHGALSVGPMLGETDFVSHPINKDASLGSHPPFMEQRLARLMLYETASSVVHLKLFDGRPHSETFPGVTCSEAADLAQQDEPIRWGCFLDPGQSAKLCVRQNDTVESYGNTHYLQWPAEQSGRYIWSPRQGRPIASAITLQ